MYKEKNNYAHCAKNFKNLLLMNHWLKCIDIWQVASLGQGDSSLFK